MADRDKVARSLTLRSWRLLASLALPILRLIHASRLKAGKEDPARSAERFGFAAVPRPEGRLVWIHAASVGETNSILPLVERLTADGHAVLLTTVTRTSAEIAAQRLPAGAIHQFSPFDAPQLVTRFLDHWRPDLALVVESELWPSTFSLLALRGIPLVIVNGRMSARSFVGWRRAGRIARALFSCVDLCLAQSQPDAARYRQLGIAAVRSPGNLKYDAEPPSADPAALAALSSRLDGRTVWLAASTHPGEEEIALDAHEDLRARHPDLLLLLMPRHPARGDEVAAMLQARRLGHARRSAGELPGPDDSVYLVDTLGEMGVALRLARAVFLGGSFALVGGHNPVEPAQLGVPLITGPHVANARALYRDLWDGQASLRVDEPAGLAAALDGLLRDPVAAAAMAARARAVSGEGAGALKRTLDELQPFLYPAASDGKPGDA
ncbi:3-deoxy-D-manno-octulosonic acid transferase [Microvirga tunisiensis]|uniref:3-deoxy-D-manno-octulosonic acid transferase n=1 Tax=Pannonibacter tanglangensis TaxID=2750084 RepID=A0A7X5J8Y5_9HYPH|nr:3-deoxy-D-manno-octulosonic acid transferase [Pannonibacter sp. XCT-53]NBN78977.1 3-deoxy-D-manno-octulosonic acid transferase [Pannonibacter sp. XCT-53]